MRAKSVADQNVVSHLGADRAYHMLKIQHIVDKLVRNKACVKVLEAGCGSVSHVNVGDHAHIVGIDISKDQLERNSEAVEKIHADIQEYKLPPAEYDLVICWNVLEHLPHPESALCSFATAVKENGIILLAMPNVLSAIGMLTKLTPHWFHVWVYRHVFGKRLAVEEGRGPFRTLMRFSISPSSIKRFARKNGLTVECLDTYDPGLRAYLKKKHRFAGAALGFVCELLEVLSFRRLDAKRAVCIVILRKFTGVYQPASEAV